jgi:hypothetical protein
MLSFARSVPYRLLMPAALNSGSDRGEALGEETSSIGIPGHEVQQGSFDRGRDPLVPFHHPIKSVPMKARWSVLPP